METLKWTSELRPLAGLKNWDKNPRTITEEAFSRLKERLLKRGMHDVLIVDGDVVLSGNQRLRALQELGATEVWVMKANRELTETEKDAIALESNRSDGQWDYSMLSNTYDVPFLQEIGFTAGELGLSGAPPVETDESPLKDDADNYINGNIRQIVIYFKPEEYADILARFNKLMTKMGVDNNTELVVKLLEHYERTNP